MEKDHAGDTLAFEKDGLFIVHPDGTRKDLFDYVANPIITWKLDCVKNNRPYSFAIGDDPNYIGPITCNKCGRIFLGIFYKRELCPECIDKQANI